MNILLVEVICPSTSRTYDYRIPAKMVSADVKKRIISDIRQYEGMPDLFQDETNVHLFCERCCIDDDKKLCEVGIKSGSSLMII